MSSYYIKEITKNWETGPYYYPNSKEEKDLPPEQWTKGYWWGEDIGEIYFENNSQKAIWMALQGQLSDGNWENRNVDWKFWTKLKPIIDKNKLGWKVNGDYIPYGEWPVDIYELECVWDDLYGVAKYFSENTNYEKENFNNDINQVTKSMATSLRPIGYIDQTVSDTIKKYEEITNSDWFKQAYTNKSLYPGEKKEIPLRIKMLMERCEQGKHIWRHFKATDGVDSFFEPTGMEKLVHYINGPPEKRGCIVCGKEEIKREYWEETGKNAKIVKIVVGDDNV